jgi:predicted NACHT family NTPase
MTAMSRIVRQIKTTPDKRDDEIVLPFADFADQSNLVVLGDPGAGKTHLFREAAAAVGARFLKARAFLNTPAHMLFGQTLYIDGLDERRAGRGDQDTVDAMVEKLFAVAPSKVRLSCRAADWLGESDLAAFHPYFEQSGAALVLLLQSLSADEQLAVLAEQGVDSDTANAFLAEAERRGLGDFLRNPQNLIMLWRAVQTGSWPESRRQLFELSTQLMLEEFNPDRARRGSGSYSAAELRPATGGICAARLISDVDAISLTDQEGTPDIPGYRSATFFAPEIVQAALGRRVFDAGAESETVDYAHRTTAEFLAAEFLAKRVRDGLPIGRVTALMGVDGHPAPELRGLHAWLAVHLPEHADLLIGADPYGVLTYGDAASLAPSSCAGLVRELDRLSRNNPWFRSGNWQSLPIGALARQDMVPEFRAVLNNPDSGFGIRSVVVDALSLGTPIPEMLPDLAAILGWQASPFAERTHALNALLRLGDAGKTAIRDTCRNALGVSLNDLRLRAQIIGALYGEPFGPADVIALINDLLEADETMGTGMLWNLGDRVPIADLPEILDGINAPSQKAQDRDRATWEPGSFYARILVRAWSAPGPFDPGRTLNWLRKRATFKGGRGESRAKSLLGAMREMPERIGVITDHFLETVPIDDQVWLAWHRFREAILFELEPDALLDIAVARLASANTDRREFLYQLGLSLSYQANQPNAGDMFDRLYATGEPPSRLAAVRDSLTVSKLPANYFSGRTSRLDENVDSREPQRQQFDQDAEQIRSGAHIGWMQHLARIYFALYDDVDRELGPRDRLSAWLEERRVETALAGLRALVSRGDVPSFADVMKLTADHQHYDWWYGLTAGLNERWSTGQALEGLSDDFLKAMLAFDLANPVSSVQNGSDHWLIHPWRRALSDQRPELVRDTYLAVARLRLSRQEQIIDGLSELLNDGAFEPHHGDIALELLREFPNASPFRLRDLLDAVMHQPSTHQQFLERAEEVLANPSGVDERQRDMWLVTAYMLAPSRLEQEVENRAAAHSDLVFDLRDRSGFANRSQPGNGALPLSMLEFMARLTGTLFPQTAHPSRGWSGDTNAWDASEHFSTLANIISVTPSEAATSALQRLEASPALASYRPQILHALANQRQRRRDAEYDRPDWSRTVKALADGAPATVADLHALLVTHLLDLRHRIARDNTDPYKLFWNLDQYAKPDNPRPEEACRDDVVMLMRPSLLPLGITVEPEGHMARDKRADISVAMPGRKILCELKRDYHSEVWVAMEGQLDRFYAHDPEAKGFGIYCVFWFGPKRPQTIRSPPHGLGRPQSAIEMERMLKDLLPENMRGRLAVVVIDVSGDV